MNNHKREHYATETLDFQIDQMLKASPGDPVADQDELFLQQLHEAYLPGKEYDLSLKRVRQRLETHLEASTGALITPQQSSREGTRLLARFSHRNHGRRRPLSLLAAAILGLLLIASVLVFYRVYSNGCAPKICSASQPARPHRPASTQTLPQFYAVTQLSENRHVKGHDDQILYHFDPSTGKTLWQFVVHNYSHTNPDGSISGGSEPMEVQEAHGMLYIRGTGTDGMYIYALNAVTGVLAWQLKCGDFERWSCDDPVIINNILYLVQDDSQAVHNGLSTLIAMNAPDGHVLWRKPFGFLFGFVATTGQTLFALREEMPGWEIYSIDARNGSINWQKHYNAAADETPGDWQIANGKLYEISWVSPSAKIQTGVSRLMAFDIASGNVDWTVQLQDTEPQMILAQGVLYVETNPDAFSYSTLYALRASNGVQLWKKRINQLVIDLEVVNGTIYIISWTKDNHSFLSALRTSDGSQLWQYAALDQMVFHGIAVDGNSLYIGNSSSWSSTVTVSNQVLVLNRSTGTLVKTLIVGKDGTNRSGQTMVFSLSAQAGS